MTKRNLAKKRPHPYLMYKVRCGVTQWLYLKLIKILLGASTKRRTKRGDFKKGVQFKSI